MVPWHFHLPLWCLALLVCQAEAVSENSEKRPHVLLIISDDQGYSDFGFTGNSRVRTPHLDQLAAKSALYRNFVVAPACSPSRAALFTGRNHLLTGVWGVPPRANLHPDETRMPAFFKAAGYRTCHIGKLDSVQVAPHSPADFGWDSWIGGGGYQHKDPTLYTQNGKSTAHVWTVDLWTDSALHFLEENRTTPCFLSLAYIIPHLPWICPESSPFSQQGLSSALSACYGSIAQLDTAIGRLLDGLKRAGLDQNTLLVFLSDNGMSNHATAKNDPNTERKLSAEDWQIRNLHNLAGHKTEVWENGIRVPLLIRWPGRILPGNRPQFAMVEDVLPTLLELTTVPAIPHLPFTGISLVPSLQSPDSITPHPDAFRMAISGAGSPKNPPGNAESRLLSTHHLTVRNQRFKFHAFPDHTAALYDLESDPNESTDVQTLFPDQFNTLRAACTDHWTRITHSGRAFAPPAALKKAR
jgi:arylsulfatase A-like enzyme